MKVRPVGRCRRPGYPSRDAVLRDSGLLRRNVPLAWRKSARVTAAMSIIVAAGCQPDNNNANVGLPIVAPLFEHGKGMGASGCVVITPPSFISEEESLTIIAEELGRAGFSMSKRNVEFKELKVTRLYMDGYDKISHKPVIKSETSPLVMDLVDSEKGVAVEYVCLWDCEELGGKPTTSTEHEHDSRGVGSKLVDVIRATSNAPKMSYGIFYDPMIKSWNDVEHVVPVSSSVSKYGVKDLSQLARDQLRLQVRDFIEWVKGQGVI